MEFPQSENGKASDEQIKVWKKLHDEIFELEIEGNYAYLHGFDRATMKFALSRLNVKIDPSSSAAEMNLEKIIEIGEIAMQNCWLGGSEKIRTSERLFTAAAMQAGSLFEIAEVKLKKL